jgi:BirA family biotin operon repressor/biotin-[acetyl-CoA-carboxylase] ligase
MQTSELVLSYLINNKDDWISGEYIGKEINLTRAAISKNIRKLKKLGYNIESIPKKGYRLISVSDNLLPPEILPHLKNKFIDWKIVHQDVTESTNNDAIIMAKNNAENGTILITENQTGGKGRKNRYWHSAKNKGIYLSLILRPEFSPEYIPRLTILTQVAIFKTLQYFITANIIIKWPNDILINTKKVSGILMEISATMDKVVYAIIGVGININLETEDLPLEFRYMATSLKIFTGKTFSRKKILAHFLDTFSELYQTIDTPKFNDVVNTWKANANIIGKKVEIELFNKLITGCATDISNEGALVISTDKKQYRIISGDVRILK